jgi:anti-sigma regulatory factor (Ser/Thr protein kinase)
MRRHFPNDPACVPAVRAFVRAALGSRDVELIERVSLLVTELASNAVRHTNTAIEVVIEERRGRVRVSVRDASTRRPRRRHSGPDDVDGRGLQIVEALADRWGVDLDGGGKSVWFEVAASAAH